MSAAHFFYFFLVKSLLIRLMLCDRKSPYKNGVNEFLLVTLSEKMFMQFWLPGTIQQLVYIMDMVDVAIGK